MCGRAAGPVHRTPWVLPAVPETEFLPQGSFVPDADKPKSSSHIETRWVLRVLRQPSDQDPALLQKISFAGCHTPCYTIRPPPETHHLCPARWWPFPRTPRQSHSATHQGHEQRHAPSAGPCLPGTTAAGGGFLSCRKARAEMGSSPDLLPASTTCLRM